MSQNSFLSFQDYLDASGDAAKRTRTIIIILVVASALTFVGLLNSLPHSWVTDRLQTLGRAGMALNKALGEALDADEKKSLEYLQEKIGQMPDRYKDNQETEQYKEYREQYRKLYATMIEIYATNTFTIRVPFFGFAFDINYLGLLSGLGFIIILILLRFALTRELDNLHLSFEQAEKRGALPEFYDLLAMRQVLTIPSLNAKQRSGFLAGVIKLLCFLPLLVYAAVTWNDIRTAPGVGEKISESLTNTTLLEDYFFLVCILILTFACYNSWRQIDKEWDKANEKGTPREEPTSHAELNDA